MPSSLGTLTLKLYDDTLAVAGGGGGLFRRRERRLPRGLLVGGHGDSGGLLPLPGQRRYGRRHRLGRHASLRRRGGPPPNSAPPRTAAWTSRSSSAGTRRS